MADSENHLRLDSELRALHGGPEAERLAKLHIEAADLMPDAKARRFHLTQAWVYALVAGEALTIEKLEKELRRLGGL